MTTTDILQVRLVPSEHAVESRVGEETVLLHLENGTYYGLDAVGTRIWALLKEGMEPQAICEILRHEYGQTQDVITSDVRVFLSDLEAQGIVSVG